MSYLYATCIRPVRGLLLLLVATTFTANLCMVAQPILLSGLVGTLLGPQVPLAAPPPEAPLFDLNYLGARVLGWLGPAASQGIDSVPLLGALYLLQVVGVALLTYVSSLIAHRIKVTATALLQTDVAAHLLSLGLRFFHRERSGELLSRFIQDIRSTAQGLGPVIQVTINDAMQIVLLGAMLISTSVWLTLAAAALIAIHFGLTQLMKRPMRVQGRLGFDAWAALSTTLQEGLANIRVTKSFAAERFELDKLRRVIGSVERVSWRYGLLEKAEAPLRSVVDAAAILGILLIAVVQLRTGSLTTHGVVMYLFVGRMLIAPISHMATNALAIHALLASYERIRELLAEKPDVRSGSIVKTRFNDRIRLDKVEFAYAHAPVINGITLDIRRGEMLAIVGPSGAGKSTLVDLLLRMYDPQQGALTMDGVDVRKLQQRTYLRLFGVVPQESLLFHDSVRNNILFGRTDLTEDDVTRAAHIAHAEHFIAALPNGYDTVIGDRGVRLSGGERQRLAIARAVAHQPQILVLDEATSSLDSESERQVQDAIDEVVRETTAIVIAHRLSTVLHADRIVVIDGGRVLDVGRHAELLERCPLYRTLCEHQFQPQRTASALASTP